MGGKHKPTRLKLLKGTLRKERMNPDEPEYKIEIPAYPKHLNLIARREWKRVSTMLFNQGLLSCVDMAALAAYCVAFSRWVEAENELKKSDSLLIKTTSGNIIQNPYIGVANTAMTLMMRMLTEFGMTPSSRAKVIAKGKDTNDGKNKKKKDPWGQLG